MNNTEVYTYINQQSSLVKEVFSSIVTNKSKATKSAAKDRVVALADILNDGLFGVDVYLKTVEVSTFMSFAEELDHNQQKTLLYRSLFKPFKSFWLRIICYLYELNYVTVMNYSEQSDRRYYEIGDAIVLAGLYIYLTENHET